MSEVPDSRAADPAVLLIAPLAGDRRALTALLESLGFAVEHCPDGAALEKRLGEDGSTSTLFVIVTHEGATEGVGERLQRVIVSEPEWSRLPVVFLVSDPRQPPPGARRLLNEVGEPPVIIVDRPAKKDTLASIFQFQALARYRQFHNRDLIGELETAERDKDFLLRELQHRTRNSFSVLQSMFRLTAARHTEIDALAADFSARLGSLVKAHTRLSSMDKETHTLRTIIHEHVAPYCLSEQQIELAGPPVHFDMRMTFDLATIVHELATNASKYGSLSADGGMLHVSWSIDSDTGQMTLRWKEKGGPKVSQPTRKGLGSQLVGSFSSRPGVEARLEYEPDGVLWEAVLSKETYALDTDEEA